MAPEADGEGWGQAGLYMNAQGCSTNSMSAQRTAPPVIPGRRRRFWVGFARGYKRYWGRAVCLGSDYRSGKTRRAHTLGITVCSFLFKQLPLGISEGKGWGGEGKVVTGTVCRRQYHIIKYHHHNTRTVTFTTIEEYSWQGGFHWHIAWFVRSNAFSSLLCQAVRGSHTSSGNAHWRMLIRPACLACPP